MRLFVLTLILSIGLNAKAAKVALNDEIKETTLSQKFIHKKLLLILNDSGEELMARIKETTPEVKIAAQDFEILLSKNP